MAKNLEQQPRPALDARAAYDRYTKLDHQKTEGMYPTGKDMPERSHAVRAIADVDAYKRITSGDERWNALYDMTILTRFPRYEEALTANAPALAKEVAAFRREHFSVSGAELREERESGMPNARVLAAMQRRHEGAAPVTDRALSTAPNASTALRASDHQSKLTNETAADVHGGANPAMRGDDVLRREVLQKRAQTLSVLSIQEEVRYRNFLAQGKTLHAEQLKQEAAARAFERYRTEKKVVAVMNRGELVAYDRALDTGDQAAQSRAFASVAQRFAAAERSTPSPRPQAIGVER